MKNNNRNYQNKKQLNIIIIAIVILAGCGFVNYALGISNPAAVYCDELGYQHIIKETGDGQQGFCQFPNGLAVDEWKFFVGEEGKEYSYCQKQGLETKTIIGEQCQYASKCAVCILEDGTEMDVTKLMDLNLKSTLLPWNPTEQTDDDAEEPVSSKTNQLLYFVGIIILIISLAVAFVVYKKVKNRSNYY